MQALPRVRRLIGVLLAGSLAAACSAAPSVGTMPPPGPDGVVQPSSMPDFLAVAGVDGAIAGYVPSRFLDPSAQAPLDGLPVYGRDLQTLVGHIVSGRGFVPIGVDPATVPTQQIDTAAASPAGSGETGANMLTVYVENSGSEQLWIAVLLSGQVGDAQGYQSGMAVGCLSVSPGAQLDVLSGPPQGAPRVLQTVFTQTDSEDSVIWLEVDARGAVNHGRDVPTWWSGGAQAC